MSSLWNYWMKMTSNVASGASTTTMTSEGASSSAPPSPLPLTSSSSADTIENHHNNNSHPPTTAITTTLSSSSRRVIELPAPTPVTPQGLKPRSSFTNTLATHQLQHYPQVLPPYLPLPSTTTCAASSTSSSTTTTTNLLFLSSPIVSTSSFYSSSDHHNNSTVRLQQQDRYHNYETRVAESPILLPGRARTAVGALVAAYPITNATTTNQAEEDEQKQQQTPPSRMRQLVNQSHQSILPPFEDDHLGDDDGSDEDDPKDEDQHQHGHDYYYSSSSSFYNNNNNKYSSTTATMMYLSSLMCSPDMVERLRSPEQPQQQRPNVRPRPRRLLDVGVATNDAGNNNNNARVEGKEVVREKPASPSSGCSVVAASPSSLAAAGDEKKKKTKSYSSFALPPPPPNGPPPPLVPQQQMMRNTMNMWRRQPQPQQQPPYVTGGGGCRGNDAALQQRKLWNQRRAHEELVVAILERLQDNVELVRDMMMMSHGHEYADDDGANKEGLLKGLSADSRDRITHTLTLLLQEMDVTEDLFHSSPSDIATFSVSHKDFHDTLRLCLYLVRVSSSTAADQQQLRTRWKLLPGMKASMGLGRLPPEGEEESPCNTPDRRRGGDTSLFSLPSDSEETPMTSNVSISTTITSKDTMTLHQYHHHQYHHHHNHQEALQIRHTITVVTELLSRMSKLLLNHLACNNSEDKQKFHLSSASSALQELKKSYLHMMQTLDLASLRGVVESFEMVEEETKDHQQLLPSLGLLELESGTMSSSEEEPDTTTTNTVETTTTSRQVVSAEAPLSAPVFPPHQSARPLNPSYHGNLRTSSRHLVSHPHAACNMQGSQINRTISSNEEDNLEIIFSPMPLEGRSCFRGRLLYDSDHEQQEDGMEVDDLRRQVGSVDYDDDDDDDLLREGPPPAQQQQRHCEPPSFLATSSSLRRMRGADPLTFTS